MYKLLKRIAKNFVSRQWLKSNERTLRGFIAIFYIGSKYQCNLCQFYMKQFINVEKGGKMCPKCGSLSRNRRLWSILANQLKKERILHFSPTPQLKKAIALQSHDLYVTSDFSGEFNADKQFDIVQITEEDETYTIIICYHILEHIVKDLQAMKELFRVLKPNGTCYIQTPFKTGSIYEDDSIVSPESRLMYFGQEDHVRIYSVQGLKERLESVGFLVNILSFCEDSNNFNGFSEQETILVAIKA
jgi:predicted SAM-dependent methyltransferase